jgi:regulatory protein
MSRDDSTPELPDDATITGLAPLPSDPNMRSVRVAGRAVARLRAADVEAIGLAVGAPWTDAVAAAVSRARRTQAVRKAALRLLATRGRSARELEQRLVRRGFEADAIDAVLAELRADGWLDDAAHARAVAERLVRDAPAGAALVEERLRAHHIDDDLAGHVAREVLAGSDPVDDAERLGRQRLRAMGRLAPHVAARRIAGALARRGFDEETVLTALHRLKLSLDDEC